MRRAKSAGIVAVFLLVAAISASAAPSPAEKQIFDELNQERQKAGLAVLEWDEHVAEAARGHARNLARNEQLSHQYPGEPSLAERLGSAGVRFTRAAENVARTEYVEDVHLALMSSPGHRSNILDPGYNAAGIGVVLMGGRVLVAEDFVFMVPVYSENEFSANLAAAINQARKEKGLREIDAHIDPLLHDLACATNGNAQMLSGKVKGNRVVVFNSSQPRQVPEEVLAVAGGYERMALGVCFRPDKEHGSGNFWVVATFAR